VLQGTTTCWLVWGKLERRASLDWVGEHSAGLRRSAYGQRSLCWTLSPTARKSTRRPSEDHELRSITWGWVVVSAADIRNAGICRTASPYRRSDTPFDPRTMLLIRTPTKESRESVDVP
jgi:hypothetical protein